LEAANFKSAPGIDGYSNRFINEFWIIFWEPLFKCFVQCLDETCLTENFATVNTQKGGYYKIEKLEAYQSTKQLLKNSFPGN
jgi:hypothetical protein